MEDSDERRPIRVESAVGLSRYASNMTFGSNKASTALVPLLRDPNQPPPRKPSYANSQ
jgi:hypothetical protein